MSATNIRYDSDDGRESTLLALLLAFNAQHIDQRHICGQVPVKRIWIGIYPHTASNYQNIYNCFFRFRGYYTAKTFYWLSICFETFKENICISRSASYMLACSRLQWQEFSCHRASRSCVKLYTSYFRNCYLLTCNSSTQVTYNFILSACLFCWLNWTN